MTGSHHPLSLKAGREVPHLGASSAVSPSSSSVQQRAGPPLGWPGWQGSRWWTASSHRLLHLEQTWWVGWCLRGERKDPGGAVNLICGEACCLWSLTPHLPVQSCNPSLCFSESEFRTMSHQDSREQLHSFFVLLMTFWFCSRIFLIPSQDYFFCMVRFNV